MIPVTKPYLPDRAKLDKYIDGIYERNWLTNNGQLVRELTHRLQDYLGVDHLLLVANGTLALQIAYKTLGIHEPVNNQPAEAITTPFTFVATASSLKWEGIEPVFVDIDPDTWNLAPENIESAITPQTRAIVPVHVFGNPCEVEKIQEIADKHKLKVIYDAAHTFGIKTNEGKSILNYGDASTLSFHATKLFHTVEGGAIIFRKREDLERAKKMINFGITGIDQIEGLGINAKLNEFEAAVGLCILEEIDNAIEKRKNIWEKYEISLGEILKMQKRNDSFNCNYSYFPVLFKSENELITSAHYLEEKNIYARRYFRPSLDSLTLGNGQNECQISLDIASRVLCLPIYSSLSEEQQEIIIRTLLSKP